MELTMVIIAALAPAVMLLYYIYRKDSFQKEPVKEVLKAFFFGVLSIFVSLTISHPLGEMGLFVDNPQGFIGALTTSFFGAAIPEEIAKFIMFWLIVRRSRYFDEHMDGIVYASSVALGFAALENIFYLLGSFLIIIVSNRCLCFRIRKFLLDLIQNGLIQFILTFFLEILRILRNLLCSITHIIQVLSY